MIKSNICFLIPARKNSIRLKNKNLKLFKNKPLIFHTFNLVKKINMLDHTYISSNDDKILKLAKENKINILFKRPENISKSSSSTLSVIKHFLKELKKNDIRYEYIAILQPTSTLRKASTVKKAYKYCIENKLNSLISVSYLPFKSKFLIKPKNNIIYKKDLINIHKKIDDIYFINGAIYIFNIKILEKNSNLIFNKNNIFKMSFDESVDIDNIDDFKLASKL